MPNFTKGEWECWKHEKYPFWYVGRKGSERFLASVDKEANARLIAAAPDMYRLLRLCLPELGFSSGTGNRERVKALLARIDGKEDSHD